MTKRPSPFEPDICRQSKIHFNNIENDIMALKHVEERTLKKLMDGSRKLHSIILSNGDNIHTDNEIHQKSDHYLQMCVTNYFTVNGKKVNENDKVVIAPSETPNRCFFCESRTNSVYQCVRCLEFYCSGCSFLNYDSTEDRRICLSCS